MSAGPAAPAVETVAATYNRIEQHVSGVVQGKPQVIRLALIALLAEGHLLVEDVPGVGKTMLAKSIARSIACSVRRVQFTPDLLPSDITGTTVYNAETHDWEFKPGAVFANIVLGDEINRAGPKTQSALLEAMEEHTVTVDGTTHALAVPFMVVATQNPIELDGTYALPEAQRDRFMMRVTIGYPSSDAELQVLNTHGAGDAAAALQPVATAQEIAGLIDVVKHLHAADALKEYVVGIVRATREHPAVELGCSPRAGLALLRAGRAAAACLGRDYVVPDDVKALAPHVLSHRLILTPDARMAEVTPESVIADVLGQVPIPRR
ncbi:AAA family ATPase [Euzebya rosea]|uniref:AAA family ATPase n=1 Tax=Euzebya rosea TaxID=2052804 RepID=UPI000D3E9D60|nr:MoxR family ATPase [Euzebya rosea]